LSNIEVNNVKLRSYKGLSFNFVENNSNNKVFSMLLVVVVGKWMGRLWCGSKETRCPISVIKNPRGKDEKLNKI
jgi:hypothetical protein